MPDEEYLMIIENRFKKVKDKQNIITYVNARLDARSQIQCSQERVVAPNAVKV